MKSIPFFELIDNAVWSGEKWKNRLKKVKDKNRIKKR